jgi:hypothetical protein
MRDIQPWVWILFAAITGGGGSIVGTKYRLDAFTGSEAELMEQRLTHKIEVGIVQLKAVMPPPATKRRIQAIEDFLSQHFDEGHAQFHARNPDNSGHPHTSVFAKGDTEW